MDFFKSCWQCDGPKNWPNKNRHQQILWFSQVIFSFHTRAMKICLSREKKTTTQKEQWSHLLIHVGLSRYGRCSTGIHIPNLESRIRNADLSFACLFLCFQTKNISCSSYAPNGHTLILYPFRFTLIPFTNIDLSIRIRFRCCVCLFFWFVHSSFLSKSHGDKHIEKCKQTTFNVRTNEANEKQNKQAANSKQAKQLSMGDLTCISYTLICVIQNRISIESMRCHSNFGASNRYTINLWLMIPAINSFLRSDLPIWQ